MEWILNSVMNRFQLNYARNVGATSSSIRQCAPKSKAEWEQYYFDHVQPKDHITQLGKKLYIKITEVVHAEVSKITEEDCINYMLTLVIDKTYTGYKNEIDTVYGQLSDLLGVEIHPASDLWDRRFNVDFYIQVGENNIGLQIKPQHKGIQLSQLYQEKNRQRASHQQFSQQYGGQVFYVFSTTVSGKKEILNPEVVGEIKNEIARLHGIKT